MGDGARVGWERCVDEKSWEFVGECRGAGLYLAVRERRVEIMRREQVGVRWRHATLASFYGEGRERRARDAARNEIRLEKRRSGGGEA